MIVMDLKGNKLKDIPFKRSSIFIDTDLIRSVEKIIQSIYEEKDKAIVEYLKKFDDFEVDFDKNSFIVSENEIEEAIKTVNSDQNLKIIFENFLLMADRVKKFHEAQMEHFNLKGKWTTTTNGTVGQVIKPIESVCVYVPGGRAIYPSTLIMNTIPAKVAGVKKIYVSTPSKSGKISPIILALSQKLGIDSIYKLGGAVAVASFAFGTQTVPRADMIVGPGNKYFITAKKLLNGIIGIDMLPGPSEIVVIADHGSPHHIALDLLSQLEHDPDSNGYFISTDQNLMEEVKNNIILISKEAERKEILSNSLNNFFFILVSSIEEAFEVSNRIAPEHLEVVVKGVDINNIHNYVNNAGTVIIGETTPVVITDYIAGVNHVLPTGATARFSSPLGVYNFVKFYNIAQWNSSNLQKDIPIVSSLADYEGLEIHKLSVERRKI
ncbi:MAG: histidinol dehydrogenase [Brevinematales bacterium]|nr:histidinol dehydrogenase [Brevinematales bacterium]